MSEQIVSTPDTDLNDPVMRSMRWRSLMAALLGWTLDAMDWMILALVLTHIGTDFGLGMTQLGLLGTITLLGAAISGLVAGVIADKYGRVRILTVTMVWYAVFTAACGFVDTFEHMLILRFLTGLGLGGEWGIGAALVSEYWPEKYRARATSFVHSGWPIGYGLASLAYLFILPEWGWRAMFFIGIIPAIVAMWVRLAVPEPKEWRDMKEKMDALAKQGKKAKLPLATLFDPEHRRTTLFAMFWMGGMLMAYWGAATWLPAFLSKARGLNVVKTGSFLIVLNIGAFFSYQFFGWLADVKGRRYALLLGCCCSVVATLIYVSIQSEMGILIFGPIFGFMTYGIFGPAGAYISEMFPPEVRATATSFVFNFGRGLAMLSPFLIGAVADRYGLIMGLGMTAFFSLIAVVCLIFLPETKK